MGQVPSTHAQAKGHWAGNFLTGYRWATDPLTSDSDVQKVSGLVGDTWGPYTKRYTKSWLGWWDFTPPESVDGVPILCRCRNISQYMKGHKGRIADVLLTKTGCWEDDAWLFSPSSDHPTFRVHVNHPAFAVHAGARVISMMIPKRGHTRRSNRRNGHSRRNRRN